MARKNPKRKCGSDDYRERLKKMNYALVGETSAVQVCRWTKNALRGDRGCWKEKFYGVSSAGCCQMTPAVMWCENQCLHCWRPIEMNLGTELPCVDEPVEILDGIVEARKKLLMGFKGREGIDVEKLEAAMEPSLYTMSLSGEPTLYPRLGEMFKEIRRRGAVSFLVTNGLNPSVLANLETLPTQITISMNAPNEKLFKIWHKSSKPRAWELFNESLDVMRGLEGVRKTVRLTLVKDENMLEKNILEYVDLIRKASPDFVHVKGFTSVGYARERLGYDKQPWFDEVKDYALKIVDKLDGYEIAGEDERCCVVMLAKRGAKLKIGKV